MTSSRVALDEGALQKFSADVGGRVLRPGDGEYDAARAVWNGMIDRRPALIVRCASTDDVVRGIALARSRGLPLAVRGGGHSAAGLGVCDDGVVLDLRGMRGVKVDADKRTARVQGGATWGDFDTVAQEFGLATTGGVISSTGVGGLTLGGGIGWLMRRFGLASDNLLAAEVVTADGRVLKASAEENADLFWAIRGGGGNFGVVTEFEFQLYPITHVTGGLIVHPGDRARDVLRFYRDITAAAGDELTAFCVLMTSPEGARIAALVVGHCGSEADAEKALRPLREFGPPIADTVARVPYAQHQKMLDDGFPSGLHVYWRGDFVKELSDGFIDTLVDRFATITSPLSALLIEHLGGAVSRVAADATAFAHRAAPYNLVTIGRWAEAGKGDAHVAWARASGDAVRPFVSGGVYVNYLGLGDGADRVRDAYGAGTFERLTEIKRRYDPENIFRVNHNIAP